MRAMLSLCLLLAAMLVQQTPALARACTNSTGGLGVSRIVEIDVSGGPLFGAISKRKREPSFLAPKEVVLTFDDGPVPWITAPILKTLDDFCTKATFFAVGAFSPPSAGRPVVIARTPHSPALVATWGQAVRSSPG